MCACDYVVYTPWHDRDLFVTQQHSDELGAESPTQFSADPNSGPEAVMRNLLKVLPAKQQGVYHTLALRLLARNIYMIGTIQTNKKGFPPALTTTASSRPANTPRGSMTVAVTKCCPQLRASL
ncbi:hypothetical protein PHMEG_0009463 [Phytophthora megakarya]|uniref:Uncharacterized protein n=1 Tax=Phytophthora megakarya TaxID=4795 RepID=A0A225WGG0_9STRA|nr:hypothetical protein PHMEG_0009463 [Phytophthora megakarya]